MLGYGAYGYGVGGCGSYFGIGAVVVGVLILIALCCVFCAFF